MKNEIDVKYNKDFVELIITSEDNKKEVFSLSYKEVKKLNHELKKALDYDKRMNIVTCSVCQGKKQIPSGGRWKETVICYACGGKGYTKKRDF